MTQLGRHFSAFRRHIVGIDRTFETPFGRQEIVYADWIASGRLYRPIEERLTDVFGPLVGNTHSESSVTGTTMTRAYLEARKLIKGHVGAGPEDVLISAGSGMTSVVNKFQRILGLRAPESLARRLHFEPEERPLVVLSHMEHHSNHTSWLETIADVEVLPPDEDGLVDPEVLRHLLASDRDRPLRIGSFTACSNVTGVFTPYHELARIMHEAGGLCFVDFAASAPYVDINMHPDDPLERLDAIFFSPHKFLGGPGSTGILVFDGRLDPNFVPDCPGGGTVNWTNPWGEYSYLKDVEAREDGGTPGFLQTIRAALAVRLKEEMGTELMQAREEELLATCLDRMDRVQGLHVLARHVTHRLGVVSFYLESVHYNLVVKLLNDRYGVQVRGGCSCAGTYGHYLLHVDRSASHAITDRIDQGDLSAKPGWVRVSLHPTMTDEELDMVLTGIEEIAAHAREWVNDYRYSSTTNEFVHVRDDGRMPIDSSVFDLSPTPHQAARV